MGFQTPVFGQLDIDSRAETNGKGRAVVKGLNPSVYSGSIAGNNVKTSLTKHGKDA